MTEKYSGFMRWTSRMLILSMITMGLPQQSAFAAMVQTEQTIAHEIASQDRAKILAFMDRDEVRAQLEQRGVTAGEAKARVNALTDDEAHNIAGKLDKLPAGGSDFLGALLFVFIVLLITDILGFTKVFPFTRSVQK